MVSLAPPAHTRTSLASQLGSVVVRQSRQLLFYSSSFSQISTKMATKSGRGTLDVNLPPALNSLSTCWPFTGGVGSFFLAGGGVTSLLRVEVVVFEEDEEDEEDEEEEREALSIAFRPPSRHKFLISSQFFGTAMNERNWREIKLVSI